MSQECNYIFKAKTKEAFVIKVLSELLYNTGLKYASFKLDSEGIHFSQADPNHQQLIIFNLNRENFNSYKCPNTLNFHVNSAHLYKMLKAIKKKDMITLYIREDNTNYLWIQVNTSDEDAGTKMHIRITYNQPEVFREPIGYENPIITSSKEFQKLKHLHHNISKVMAISSVKPGQIKFFCDGGEVYSRELSLGNENQEEEEVDEDFEEYKQTFTTVHITGLTKCAGLGQSSNVQIFVQHDLPLKIKMKAGNLGDITVFIKSKERKELEIKLQLEAERALQAKPMDDNTGEDEEVIE
jgi:proliferating cell nuclear antigen PCNA